MPLIEWQDEFKIGIPSIDHEHQELIALINACMPACRAMPPPKR